MQEGRTWILVVALVASAILAVIGSLMYPIYDFGFFYAAGYVTLVVLGALGLLLLIYKKGLPMT
jgi:hypothetical protein